MPMSAVLVCLKAVNESVLLVDTCKEQPKCTTTTTTTSTTTAIKTPTTPQTGITYA